MHIGHTELQAYVIDKSLQVFLATDFKRTPHKEFHSGFQLFFLFGHGFNQQISQFLLQFCLCHKEVEIHILLHLLGCENIGIIASLRIVFFFNIDYLALISYLTVNQWDIKFSLEMTIVEVVLNET